MTYFLAVFLRPLALALIVLVIGWPIRKLIVRRMGESRLKRLLLKDLY